MNDKQQEAIRASSYELLTEIVKQRDRAILTLNRAGFKDRGGETWAPPVGYPPIGEVGPDSTILWWGEERLSEGTLLQPITTRKRGG